MLLLLLSDCNLGITSLEQLCSNPALHNHILITSLKLQNVGQL